MICGQHAFTFTPSHLAVQARGSYFALPDTAEVASHYKNAFCGPLCILGFLRILFFSWYLYNLRLNSYVQKLTF